MKRTRVYSLILYVCLLGQCEAHNEESCRKTHGLPNKCADNDIFGCACVLEQTKCYTLSTCSTVLESRKACIDALGVGEETWKDNCALFYENQGKKLLEGWICIFLFSLCLCLFLLYKSMFDKPQRFQTYELLIISFLLVSMLFWGYYFINVFVAMIAVLIAFLFVVAFSNVFEYPAIEHETNEEEVPLRKGANL